MYVWWGDNDTYVFVVIFVLHPVAKKGGTDNLTRVEEKNCFQMGDGVVATTMAVKNKRETERSRNAILNIFILKIC
jgi:hypothetical protein